MLRHFELDDLQPLPGSGSHSRKYVPITSSLFRPLTLERFPLILREILQVPLVVITEGIVSDGIKDIAHLSLPSRPRALAVGAPEVRLLLDTCCVVGIMMVPFTAREGLTPFPRSPAKTSGGFSF